MKNRETTPTLMNAAETGEKPPTVSEVPQEIKDAIDRVATFVAEWEEDYFGEPFAARTRVSEAACALVAWAFNGEPKAKLRFFALLQKGDAGHPEELDPGLN